MNDERLAFFGGEIKALGDGKVEGYLIRFTTPDDPDLTGEFFTKSTDFGLEAGDRVPIYYHHGMDGHMKNTKLGMGTLKFDDAGVWIEAQLALRDEYEAMLYEKGVQAGKMGWSSGAAGHLVAYEQVGTSRWIKAWPIGEGSITPTPAEPRNAAVPVKSLVDEQPIEAEKIEPPEATTEAESGVGAVAVDQPTKAQPSIEVIEMTEQNEQATPDYDALKATIDRQAERIDGLTRGMERIVDILENEPAVNRSGIVTVDGGKADPHIKSDLDMVLALKRGDDVRIKALYSDKLVKAQNEAEGSAGGYAVQPGFYSDIISMASENSGIVARLSRRVVNSDRGTVYGADTTSAPTANSGQTAFAGGLVMNWVEEGASITLDDALFDRIEYNIHKLVGATAASNELVEDANGVQQTIAELWGIAYGSMIEWAVLRGNGVGKPLGILNAPATVTAGTDSGALTLADTYDMMSVFKPTMGGAPLWVIHRTILPDLGAMESTNGAKVWHANVEGPIAGTLHGYPLTYSEHLPTADTTGAAILVDPRAYYLFDRKQLTIAYSEHARFLNDEGTWRFVSRLDGQPGLESPITLADASTEVSPFVQHDD